LFFHCAYKYTQSPPTKRVIYRRSKNPGRLGAARACYFELVVASRSDSLPVGKSLAIPLITRHL
jgi:hypothetical protein